MSDRRPALTAEELFELRDRVRDARRRAHENKQTEIRDLLDRALESFVGVVIQAAWYEAEEKWAKAKSEAPHPSEDG